MIHFVSLQRTCEAYPSQWNAVGEDGWSYYIRYRWGRLTASRYQPPLTMADLDHLFHDEEVGGTLDGYMPTGEMLDRIGAVLL